MPENNRLDHNRVPKPGTYRVILADPPWGLHQRRSGKSKGYAAAEDHYPVMSDKRILGMGEAIREIAAEQSFCFLWVTAATLPLGIQVLTAWGYRYVNFYFWAKPRFTLGNTYRNAGELLLLGVRGRGISVAFKSQPNWGFHALQSHSRKPEEIHLMIERLVGADENTKMLELFARRPAPSRLNWNVWGNEIPSSEPSLISLAPWGYPVPGDHPAGAALPTQYPETPHGGALGEDTK
ncbi:hypothetical protein GCM10022198_08590 [Klugiella xanthotipulae]|uniref:N6-adenosine-specific RNA methylase IME4 n=1 Tax=Klugiella xanthotipulae TaxID=244735 RepID=A0A543I3T8_9MICO|nr:MT-A70 family methyltransferase [Klugiella xanthotipulae]TQM65227.1 N6-adenosine-specific RNA methylase IME4 [Klugiella xanthotipulae]